MNFSTAMLWPFYHAMIYVSQGIHFSIGAVTVDPGSTAYDPQPLIPYLKELGLPYFYEEQGSLVYFTVCC